MKKMLAVFIGLIFFVCPLHAGATEVDEMNRLMDDCFQLVKQEEYGKAKQILTYAAKEYRVGLHVPAHAQTISLAYNNALKSMEQENKEETAINMLALRLVIDAESSHFQPLWLSREASVMTAFEQMENAWGKNKELQQKTMNEFLQEYTIIYPSLVVDLPKQQIEQLRQSIVKLERGHMQEKQLRMLQKDVKEVFRYPSKDEVAPSLIWFMIMTGGIIIFTLTYVGWRKYRYEKERKQVPSKHE